MTIDFDSAIPIPYAPGSLLGYWKNGEPFYVIAGGASDDDEFDSKMDDGDGEDDADENNDEGDDEGSDDEGQVDDSKPEPKKSPKDEENERLRQRLAKARHESASRRKRIEELTRQLSTKESEGGSETETAAREAREAARAEVEGSYKPWVLELAASNALLAAGLKPGKERRAIKLLDMDDVDFDIQRRELSGIEDAVESLKEEWPELFLSEKEEEAPAPTSAPRVKSRDVNGAGRAAGKDKKPKTSTELAYERLVGTGGRR